MLLVVGKKTPRRESDEGVYQCLVSNQEGTLASHPTKLILADRTYILPDKMLKRIKLPHLMSSISYEMMFLFLLPCSLSHIFELKEDAGS
ncbi:unnamed protein product [Darwinula stevensoni]|uniref:Ig-like domain-containing protein n=1 Tax=Darwinula stevensoni TaxID=69355 RepID=A0A7R8X370_9CRUS|nr:unnamed protein product [Darwinula stevensoni]CAG0884191.1 unnamed protein product [Darwinula stevensoni]